MASRSRVSRVFFPWERRRGLFGVLGRARVRLVAAVVVALVLIVWIRAREERAAGIRATRATITTAHDAISAFRADHGRAILGASARRKPTTLPVVLIAYQ